MSSTLYNIICVIQWCLWVGSWTIQISDLWNTQLNHVIRFGYGVVKFFWRGGGWMRGEVACMYTWHSAKFLVISLNRYWRKHEEIFNSVSNVYTLAITWQYCVQKYFYIFPQHIYHKITPSDEIVFDVRD